MPSQERRTYLQQREFPRPTARRRTLDVSPTATRMVLSLILGEVTATPTTRTVSRYMRMVEARNSLRTPSTHRSSTGKRARNSLTTISPKTSRKERRQSATGTRTIPNLVYTSVWTCYRRLSSDRAGVKTTTTDEIGTVTAPPDMIALAIIHPTDVAIETPTTNVNVVAAPRGVTVLAIIHPTDVAIGTPATDETRYLLSANVPPDANALAIIIKNGSSVPVVTLVPTIRTRTTAKAPTPTHAITLIPTAMPPMTTTISTSRIWDSYTSQRSGTVLPRRRTLRVSTPQSPAILKVQVKITAAPRRCIFSVCWSSIFVMAFGAPNPTNLLSGLTPRGKQLSALCQSSRHEREPPIIMCRTWRETAT